MTSLSKLSFFSTGASASVRRMTACTRASSSLISKGLVT